MSGRRGSGQRVVAGIEEDVGAVSFRETDDDGETAASREALLGEDVEDDEADRKSVV